MKKQPHDPLHRGGQVPWNRWPSVRGMTGQVVWNAHRLAGDVFKTELEGGVRHTEDCMTYCAIMGRALIKEKRHDRLSQLKEQPILEFLP